MTEIVMPNHTNHLGTCFGGTIMSWIDVAAAVAAQRLAGTVVTASVDSIQFKHPIKLGDVVTLKAHVNRVWKSSMEVGVKVEVQRPVRKYNPLIYTGLSNPKRVCCAYLTFVAIDNAGNKRDASDIAEKQYEFVDTIKDTEPCWLRRYNEAEWRRQVRLERKNYGT